MLIKYWPNPSNFSNDTPWDSMKWLFLACPRNEVDMAPLNLIRNIQLLVCQFETWTFVDEEWFF